MHSLNRRAFLRGGATVAAGGLAAPLLSAAPASATGGTFTGEVVDAGGQVLNVKSPQYGAKGDTMKGAQTGQTSAGSKTFKQATQGTGDTSGGPIAFTAADVGKVLVVQGPTGGVVHSTRIAAVTSTTEVEMLHAAPTTEASAEFSYGTDDTAAILLAISEAGDDGTIYFPGGIYTVLGASNSGNPIEFGGRGGVRGRGGTMVPNAGVGYRDPNTVLLCCDATASFMFNGCARYESFMCDGNNIGTAPLQLGKVVSNQVTDAPTNATFIDVWATQSAGTGWSIYGAQNCSFHACGAKDNAADGVYVDGGASGLHWVHLEEFGNFRYGIHGDHLVKATTGSTEPTTRMRFYSGLCDGAGSLRKTVSKVYLRNAIDWRFPELIMVASNFGPTVDLDQSMGHSLDFTDSRIIGGGQDGDGNDVGIQISGDAPVGAEHTFIQVGGAKFTQAVNSISVLGDPRATRYTAVDGWWDSSSAGPAAAAGLPAVDTLFPGRMGEWQTATVLAPWSGTVTYRIMGESWVQIAGSVKHSGTGSGPVFALPLGYRPAAGGHEAPIAASSGSGVITITAAGDVSASPVGAPFASNTSVFLDGVSFPVERA